MNDADLATLANLAEIAGVFIVCAGLLFAFFELAHYRRQRREMAAIELVHSFQNPHFSDSLLIVLSMPDGMDAAELRAHDERFERSAMELSLTLESVGIMVHRKIVSLDMVWELMGGVFLAAWRKMRPWVDDMREQQNNPKFDEWMQWLAERLEASADRMGREPAYKQFR